MAGSSLFGQLQSMLEIVLYMCLPPLIVAVVVGIVVGVIQAVTQIQDQSMPLTFKLLAIIAVMFLAGPALCVPLVQEAQLVFDSFSVMTR